MEWENADKQVSQRSLTKSRFIKKLLITIVLTFGMLLAYTVVAHGDFFTEFTKRFNTSVQEDAQVNDVAMTPDSLYAGQSQESPEFSYMLIDQTVGINEVDHRVPVDAPLRGDPKKRDWATYNNVIDQFAVEENPRYEPRDDITAFYNADIEGCPVEFVNLGTGECLPTFITYCHTFVWDVTRAMGAEIPYWVDENGEPNELELKENGWWELREPAYWLSANFINGWLNQKGQESGWHEVPAEKAQEFANLGHPTVASVHEPQGFGHIGMVRPGEMSNGPALAQAGTSNVNNGYVYDYFPREGTQFFVNDAGGVVDPP